MSLDYNHIFSQIDKAKKKRKRWTQADTDAAMAKINENKKYKKVISQHRYKDPKDRKPGEKPSTYTKPLEGTGRMQSGGKGESATRDTNRPKTRGTENVKRLKEIEDKKEKEAVKEKIESQTSQNKRAVSDYKQYGRSGGKEDRSVSAVDHNARIAFAMGRAQEMKRNQDNAAKRRASAAYIASIGPGETSAAYEKRMKKKKEKEEKAKQKKQKKQDKEEEYDFQKDETSLTSTDVDDTESVEKGFGGGPEDSGRPRRSRDSPSDGDEHGRRGEKLPPKHPKGDPASDSFKKLRGTVEELMAHKKEVDAIREERKRIEAETRAGVSLPKVESKITPGERGPSVFGAIRGMRAMDRGASPKRAGEIMAEGTITEENAEKWKALLEKTDRVDSTWFTAGLSREDGRKEFQAAKKRAEAEAKKRAKESDANKAEVVWKSWLENKDAQTGQQSYLGKPKEEKLSHGEQSTYVKLLGDSDNDPHRRVPDKYTKPRRGGVLGRYGGAPTEDDKIHWYSNAEYRGNDYSGKKQQSSGSGAPKIKAMGKCANPKCDKKSEHKITMGRMIGGKRSNEESIKVCTGCKKIITDAWERAGATKPLRLPNTDMTAQFLSGDDEKLKAEEGIGGMNMGSQRGLGHEAGYKQSPGESAQITEVTDQEKLLPEAVERLDKGGNRNYPGSRAAGPSSRWHFKLPETSGRKKDPKKKKKRTARQAERDKFENDPDPEVQANYDKNIKEMSEKATKCPECESKDIVPGQYKSSKEKRGHNIKICDDCGHEWEKTKTSSKKDRDIETDDTYGRRTPGSSQRSHTSSGQKDQAETQSYTYGDDEHLYDEVRSGYSGGTPQQEPKFTGHSPGQEKARNIPLSRVEGTSSRGDGHPGQAVPTYDNRDNTEGDKFVSQLGEHIGDKAYAHNQREAKRQIDSGELTDTHEIDKLGHEATMDAERNALMATMSRREARRHKSAYENHEQDESPETKPNKQQIPASKPGMDVIKTYKKALIIKYNNIYKPANL